MGSMRLDERHCGSDPPEQLVELLGLERSRPGFDGLTGAPFPGQEIAATQRTS